MERRSWWRSNAVALAALVVVLPATVAVTTVNEWSASASGQPSMVVAVEPGGQASYSGATWSDARLAPRSDGSDLGIPPGTKLLVVTIDVDFEPGDPPSCTLTLSETTGQQRRWRSADSDLVDWTTTEGTTSYCPSDAIGPYTVEVPFVLPDDAREPFTIDVVDGDQLPRFLRFGFGD